MGDRINKQRKAELTQFATELTALCQKYGKEVMPNTVIVIQVDIFEADFPFPVVRHEFRGKDLAQALGFYYAHLKTDQFMRDCVTIGRFFNLGCRAVVSSRVEEL